MRAHYLFLPILPFIIYACDSGSSSSHGAPQPNPSATGGGGGEVGGPGGAGGSHDGTLIDDFEDGDQTSELGTGWYAYRDADAGGASVVTGVDGASSLVSPGGRESDAGLSIEYTLDRGNYAWDPFVGVGITLPETVDVTEFEGISYYYKGAGHTLRFETSNVTDYDFYVMLVPPAASWTKITVPFAALAQAGYGAPTAWEPTLLENINWHVVGTDGSAGTLELDDVWFERSAEVDRGPKNLVVKPAEPPVKTDLGDITIDTPLQQKALAQLDRGYNLTNWLESGRFASFMFDETYVENLSKAGFKALRLPIDLDLYVTDTTGTGDAMTLTIHDDLWTILDSFDTWTETYGLSFTIDYHQYDKSFGFSDEDGVDQAVALWKAVAEHFKDSARDDIYFELLNEPELSTGASGTLPASSWTPVAQRMIDAIRTEDTTHTIIFGDVNWYGIDQLAARTPFADDNIVYSFHSYEPFIFTHQGADWAGMATTHDIPFPYTPERWSEYSSDFGLTTAQPNWIWDQFRNYNVNGTPEAMWNRLAVAKAWAVEHQVPLICNEFGTYDRKSRLEDRVAYYSTLIGMFEEMEIPWQVWFMIMNEDGEVIPEYIEAFRLEQ
jgi:licheninase